MTNTRRRMIATFSCMVSSWALAIPTVASAQEQANSSPTYSLASLNGDYAVVGTYGANIARLIGTFHADGNGRAEGTALVNLPGSGTDRLIVPLSFSGPYTVRGDGTGVLQFTVLLPGGGTAPATLDLVITKATMSNGTKIATEIATAQREPSQVVNGQFVSHVATRRPIEGQVPDR